MQPDTNQLYPCASNKARNIWDNCEKNLVAVKGHKVAMFFSPRVKACMDLATLATSNQTPNFFVPEY
jgi:hypothetical protein